MSWPQPIRIVGVGSPVGDDSLGWEAIRILRERCNLPPEIELHTVEGGQRLLDLLDGSGTLLLVDAVVSDTKPGTIYRFQWPNSRIEKLRPGSTHRFRPADALQLAEALGIAPALTIVIGMEIENLDPHADLSPNVRAALPELVLRVVQELERDSAIDLDHPTIHVRPRQE